MRSIREYIRKTLFDSSSILPAYRHDAPQRVKEFAFVRAPVERLADVLSRGFVLPDKDHVYSLNSQWRVYDYSYEITSLPAINDMRRQFPPASEAFEFHGAYDAFEIYINVASSDSGMKSYVQLASFWRGNGGVGFDVSIMPDTCFEAFVFLEAARGAGGTLARSLPVSFAFEGYVDVDERGVTTSYSGVFDRLKACGTAPSAVTATLIDYDRDKERVAQACGRVEIRRVPLAFGACRSPSAHSALCGRHLCTALPAATTCRSAPAWTATRQSPRSSAASGIYCRRTPCFHWMNLYFSIRPAGARKVCLTGRSTPI